MFLILYLTGKYLDFLPSKTAEPEILNISVCSQVNKSHKSNYLTDANKKLSL